MKTIFSNFELFYPQIILGSLLGMFLSLLGIILVLRRMAFLGITLSQVATFGFALSLFLGFKGETFPIFISAIILTSVFFLTQSWKSKSDTLLGVLFVSFGSASQILLSFGGNVQNHILAAYFGDILTSEVKLQSFMFPILFVNFLLFVFFFRKIVFYSFDPEEYKVEKLNPYIDLIFFLIVNFVLSISVNLLGSFYTASQLLIPAFVGLYLFKDLKICMLFAVLFSALVTILGFAISLVEIPYKKEFIYLPTSSSIVAISFFIGMILIGFKKLNK